MLQKDRKERLGQLKDVDEILGHPWFADLDLDSILNKKMPNVVDPLEDNRHSYILHVEDRQNHLLIPNNYEFLLNH